MLREFSAYLRATRRTHHICATSWHCVFAISFFARRSPDLGSIAKALVRPVMRPQFSIAPTVPLYFAFAQPTMSLLTCVEVVRDERVQLRKRILDVEHLFVQRERLLLHVQRKCNLVDQVLRG